MQALNNKLAVVCGAFAYTFCAAVSAAPGTISDTPLIVTSTAQPNIMLMLDSSGSMGAFVLEAPYDENTNWANCPVAQQLTDTSAGGSVDVIVKSDGRVYFETNVSGSWISYDWDISSGTGHTGNANICFKADAEYASRLFGDSTATGGSYGAGTRWVSGSANRGNYGTYTGNFLNWYYSNGTGLAGANYGAGAAEKPGMRTRSEVAAEAASDLVDGMSNVNIGLSQFNSGSGGTLLQSIQDIGGSGYKTSLKSAINGITPDGSTPLGETMEEIGRYFIEGHHTNNLVLHPNSGSPTTLAGNSIFSHELNYSSGLSKPTSSSPVIEHYCQKNFIVGLTDGLPTSDTDVDTDIETYASDGDSFSLNDVALALYEMDLRPDLDDFDGNEVTNNIVTYMIGFADEVLQKDTLLQTTAANGGGSNYVADDAAGLTAAFNAISADIGARTGSVASVAFNSSTLGTGSAVFQVKFDTTKWSGSVIALPLDGNGNLPADSDGDGLPDPSWDGADKLDNFTATELNNRVILTHDGSDGIAFTYVDASNAPTAAHDDDLDYDSTDSLNDNEAQTRLAYIRGDRSNEGSSGNGYRSRNSILGDIVNSTPVYVGEVANFWPETFGVAGNRHSSNFAHALLADSEDGIKDRTPVLYVGANDGMLHGFNATVGETDSGKEVFSYIPRSILDTSTSAGLHYYADDSYIHKFYVDLTPTISDVYIKTTTTGSRDWTTVLMGGLRAGGKGYFALDVTDPNDFGTTTTAAQNTVLWEFTDSDDSDLGYTYSRPVIVKTNASKWAAIFGNGYNSTNGAAKLFILFIEEGIDGWSSSDYVEIDTGVGTSSNKNGLSSPTVIDTDGDGLADRVYAGDLFGNMWVFDISANNSGNWKSAFRASSSPSAAPVPLFTAKDNANNIQPITTAPLIARNDENTPTGGDPNALVLFGTGQYLTNADLTDLNNQTFYAVWDNSDVASSRTAMTRSDLESRTLNDTGLLRQVSGNPVDWNTQFGWYLDLLDGTSGADAGERVVSPPALRSGLLLFNTNIPDSRICSAGGSGWLMGLDYLTGISRTDSDGNDRATFDANNDGVINDSDLDGNDLAYVGEKITDGLIAQSGILGDIQYTPTSDGGLSQREIQIDKSGTEGRLGWQEITPR